MARAGDVALVTDVPRECRDVANVQMTQAIVDGDNPFEIKDNILKQFAYVYTPLNSIIVALIHKITHMGIVRLHYVVDFLYIFMSAVLLSWYIYKRKQDLLCLFSCFMQDNTLLCVGLLQHKKCVMILLKSVETSL